ncbi:MAG: hypothetical protein J6W28_00585 [Clostridia bacterium]|nr:hypothetical protein [Clostridia bacterium]MBO7169655.1 hypothetical protein [Clostridia bacterium]
MKNKKSTIQKVCLYCEHASIKRREGNTPCFWDILPVEEGKEIRCRYHGAVAPEDTCLRFTFDLTKYAPKKQPPFPTLSEEDIIT